MQRGPYWLPQALPLEAHVWLAEECLRQVGVEGKYVIRLGLVTVTGSRVNPGYHVWVDSSIQSSNLGGVFMILSHTNVSSRQ